MIDLPNQPIPDTWEQKRIKQCVVCSENIELPIPKCQLADKPLSLLTSDEQATCPLNKWQ